MKQRIVPVVILAIVTFSLVWLYLAQTRQDSIDIDQEDRLPTFQSSGREPFELKERDPKRHKGVEAQTVPIKKEEVKVGSGRLVVTAKLPDGTIPVDLIVVCNPTLPAFKFASGIWSLADVPVGQYSVSVSGGNLIPTAYWGIDVEDGKETRLKFKVRRGVKPKGKVLDAAAKTPIANAVVDFSGLASARTDAEGKFAIDKLLPRAALDVITVGNDTYGTIPFKGLLIEDVGNMKLYLGGGKGVVHIEVVNATSKSIPKDAFLRVTLPPTYEIRRQMPLNGREVLRLDNMYGGTFRFELHFPGGEFPTQRLVEEVPAWQEYKAPVAQIRFVLRTGATLKGKFQGKKSMVMGMKIQLRDLRNHIVAETSVDANGNYLLENLKAEKYVPFVVAGSVPHQLDLITIEEESVVTRDVDARHMKWIE